MVAGQAGWQVPQRCPRPLPPTVRNHGWAYDFVFDTCANRQTLKCLTIVDEWTREGIVKLRLTAVSDAQYGGFTTGSSPASWGFID